ncbi:MAG: tRNA uridine-5-carboxymethylaminomethyl(34) synthesis GTPase MnmE [Hydrogenothermaceae bacterium]|nr:tRNA uridine-5-carboxymethylaminomethyl(34) synthesis GTPase MnmE [Hydrogenothermaceae bacterium]
MRDTIVANATPLIPSGVAVIRISGDKALEIGKKLFRISKDVEPRKVYFGKIIDREDNILDEGLLIFFKKPASFTGEDVIEIHPHGSIPVVKKIIEEAIYLGARFANPGEFTERAFLNGKIDLVQAEAIAELISAKTQKAAKAAVNVLEGKLSKKINSLRESLIELITLIEAEINFPEDIEEIDSDFVISKLEEVKKNLLDLYSTYKKGEIVREGIKLAIVGRPNVGKSSLFNAFIGYERSIVSDISGTTRDFIEERVKIKDIPIILLDTAGIRETTDKIEKLGIEIAKRKIEEADIVIFVFDVSEGLTEEDLKIYHEIKDKNHIIVGNKVDLGKKDLDNFIKSDNIIYTSSVSAIGLKELEEKILEKVGISEKEDEVYINLRQKILIEKAIEGIKSIEEEIGFLIDNKEILMLNIQEVEKNLDEIIGFITTEDILGSIFSKFCIGK